MLVVDDDRAIREVVRLNLESEGFEVVFGWDVASGIASFGECECILAILDVMLPDGDGFDLARRIREHSNVPIIMLSARDSDVDKAVGLGIGADDYVTKPFSPLELIARVKAHLRRYQASTPSSPGGSVGAQEGVVSVGSVSIDPVQHRVAIRGDAVELTAKEFDILYMLAVHPGRVYTKAQIYEQVWGEEAFGDLSTVQVHIRRLRTKVERDPKDPRLIETVWGIGYRFGGSE